MYLGATGIEVLEEGNSFGKLVNGTGVDVKKVVAEKIFIHPLLGTKHKVKWKLNIWDFISLSLKQEFVVTPDLALIKLKDSADFDESISPICLTDEKMEDLPKCSDFSLDRGEGKFRLQIALLNIVWINSHLDRGGCGTVAGWGRRFDADDMGPCKTDSETQSPDKLENCLSNCVDQDHDIKELTPPCADFITEVNTMNALQKKKKIPKGKSTFGFLDINEMSEMSNYPVEIVIKLNKSKKKKKVTFFCGKTNHMKRKWCTTKYDKNGNKI